MGIFRHSDGWFWQQQLLTVTDSFLSPYSHFMCKTYCKDLNLQTPRGVNISMLTYFSEALSHFYM